MLYSIKNNKILENDNQIGKSNLIKNIMLLEMNINISNYDNFQLTDKDIDRVMKKIKNSENICEIVIDDIELVSLIKSCEENCVAECCGVAAYNITWGNMVEWITGKRKLYNDILINEIDDLINTINANQKLNFSCWLINCADNSTLIKYFTEIKKCLTNASS